MKVSACIIAKNEEENLPRLLESIKGKFDEIVLVDTGSTDRTVEIAKEYGCKVFFRKWNGFADARNYAVEKASGDWIWFFDADMELEEKEYERFLRILNLISKKDIYNGIRVIYRNIDHTGKIISFSSTVHIQKKLPELKWVGKIHERLVNEKGEIITPEHTVYVNHYGYSDFKIMKEKIKRNLKLLEEEINSLDKEKNAAEYVIKLFYLAQTYSASLSTFKENTQKVIDTCLQFLNLMKEKKPLPENSVFNKHIYVYLINAYIKAGLYSESKKFLEEALNLDENYPDFQFLKAHLEEHEKNKEEQINALIKFIQIVDRIYLKKDSSLSPFSDYSRNIEPVIDEKLPNLIENSTEIKKLWKKEKGIYMGILLSNLYLKEGNKKYATKILDKLFKLYKDPLVGNRLAKLLLESDLSKAETILEFLYREKPYYYETLYTLSDLYYLKGEYKKALDFIIEYTKRTKNSKAISLFHKLLKINNFEKEAKELEKSFTK